jgi:hypothetical protein
VDDGLDSRVRAEDLDVDGQLVRRRVAVAGVGTGVERDETDVGRRGERQAPLVRSATAHEETITPDPHADVAEDVLDEPGARQDPARSGDLPA